MWRSWFGSQPVEPEIQDQFERDRQAREEEEEGDRDYNNNAMVLARVQATVHGAAEVYNIQDQERYLQGAQRPPSLNLNEEDEEEENGGAPSPSRDGPDSVVEIENATDSNRICGPVKVPIAIEFDKVNYNISTPPKKWYSFKSGSRQILFDITGSAKPGEMMALMGPSGSGKTTLLSVIAGRVRNPEDISGTIKFNGHPYDKKLKKFIGFVMQDDILFAHLNVRETLQYAALLKLPREMSKDDKMETVENVIRLLHLERCAKSKIGGPFARGISGGERKRVSIGVEMLTNPSILLMDEPTSGLDSTVAFHLIRLLKDVAKKENRTIVCSIHQPSSQIFFLFDHLLLLVDGKIAYRGQMDNVVEYFNAQGFPTPNHYNPADYFMTLMVERRDVAKQFMALTEAETPAFVEASKIKSYSALPDFKTFPQFETKFWEQGWILSQRSFKQQFFTILSLLNISQAIAVSVITGLIWLQIPYLESRVNDRYGLVFFIVVFWAFSPFVISINSFPAERGVIQKEASGRYYHLSAYMAAKAVTEMPIIVILPIIGTTITYYMANLQSDFLSAFETILIVALSALVLQSFALLLAVIVPSYQQAVVLGTTMLLIFLILGGFYVQHIPNWLVWSKYVSLIYYAVSLLEAVQFNPTTVFQCDSNPPLFAACENGASSFSGTAQLQNTGNLDLWGLNLGVLLGCLVVFRLLSYLVLRLQLNK